jgi:uncharacterized protein (TIGR01244 family)
VIVVGLSCFGSQKPAGADGEKDLPQFTEVTPSIATAGQPTAEGFKKLAANGYKAVINLRTDKEPVDLAAEEKLVRSLGMRYYSVPVLGTDLQESRAEEFLKLMRDLGDDKRVIHCAAANRAGAFLMMHRVLADGLTVEQAEAEARRVGLRSEPLARFAKDVIEKQKAK